MSQMNVAFVFLLRRSADYGPKDVARLVRGVAKAVYPARPQFYCLTDMPAGISGVVDLPLRHLGWDPKYNKIEVFRPDVLALADRWVYLDLDTLVVGPLGNILSYDRDFAMLSDFYAPKRPASGVMAYSRGVDGRKFYDRFVAAPPGEAAERWPIGGGRGDQAFLRDMCVYDGLPPNRLQELYPGQIVSYKVHCRGKASLPVNARLVCFHGRPKPREVTEPWLVAA